MKRITGLGLAGLMALGTFAFAPPEDGVCAVDNRGTPDTADDAELCEIAKYLSCDGAIGGKARLYDGGIAGIGLPQLVDERPETSFTAGGGCGTPENNAGQGVSQDNIHDFTFEGYVDGNIDSLAVELHDFDLREQRGDGDISLGVRVTIDGESPFGYETVSSNTGDDYQPPAMRFVRAKAAASSTGLTDAYTFTITGLGDKLNTVDAGAGQVRHVKITIHTPLDGGHVFTWGASEVPAGILVNPKAILGFPTPAA